jgi:hypothetical protein
MAIVAGDEVALIMDSSFATLGRRGNVLFGIANVVTSPTDIDVLWENGQLSEGLIAAILDKILPLVNAEQAVYTFTDGSGGVNNPAYQGVVVRTYSRNPAGTGSATPFTLLRSVSDGQLYEVPTAARQIVQG